MRQFYGWVPNVAGKLSFTLSGTSAYPRQFYHSANISSGGRYFVGYQHRNLSDTTVPFLSEWPRVRTIIDNLIFNKDGNFVFLCLLKVATDRESAKGRIYAFDGDGWKTAYPKLFDPLNKIPEIWDEETVLHEALPGQGLAMSVYSARFTILRDGLVTLDSLSTPTQSALNANMERLEHAFAAQCYFCLRDLLHTHRFHSPSSDTIIDVYPDVETLKEQVNFGLMRRAIAMRRVQTAEAQQRALGIISYLRAFRENLMTEEDRKRLNFSIDATVASIQAGLPLIVAREARSLKNRLDGARTKIIAFVSLLFGYAALIRDSKVLVPDQLSWLKAVFTFIQERIGLAFILTILLLFFFQVLLSLKSESRDNVVRTSSRVALAFRLRRFAIFEIAAAVVFLILALAVVGFLVHSVLSGPPEH